MFCRHGEEVSHFLKINAFQEEPNKYAAMEIYEQKKPKRGELPFTLKTYATGVRDCTREAHRENASHGTACTSHPSQIMATGIS
jgi:hypothetical protein